MGFWMFLRLKERIRYIEQMIWLFYFMESEINYRKSEFSAVFERAAQRMDEPVKSILMRTAERLKQRGACFRDIWHEETTKLRMHSDLKKEDLDLIDELACEGYQDIQMQLTQIRMIREKLEHTEQQLKAQLAEKGKIYLCVGVLSGMVVSIILI